MNKKFLLSAVVALSLISEISLASPLSFSPGLIDSLKGLSAEQALSLA